MLLDNLAKLNRSSRTSIFIALIVIAALAMYNWIVAPHATCLFAAQQYASAVDSIAEKNKIISDKISMKKEELEQLRKQFVHLQGVVFNADRAREFFSDLQSISEQAACTVYLLNFITDGQSVKKGRPNDAPLIVANKAMLSVVGVYENIIKLVERLQNRTQKVWIDSIKMEILECSSEQPRCDMSITIYTIQDKETTVP